MYNVSIWCNKEPQYSITGFQHEQICTSNHCTIVISHCACPVYHCGLSQAKSQTEAHKAIFDYKQTHGETLSNCSASCREEPGDSNYSIVKPNSFPHAARNHAFDPVREAAANASPDSSPTNRASTSFPPIRFLSPTLLSFLVISPLCNRMNAWAEKQISILRFRGGEESTHPSHCPIYCPFPCQSEWALSWSGSRGMNSDQILPPFPKDSWYVPVMQVHGFLPRQVLWRSGRGGARDPSQGREPSPSEQKARRCRVASAKMSALWVTQVVKLTNRATLGGNDQKQGYSEKTLNPRAGWEGRGNC